MTISNLSKENNVGKGEIACFQLLQTCENQGLFGKGLPGSSVNSRAAFWPTHLVEELAYFPGSKIESNVVYYKLLFPN